MTADSAKRHLEGIYDPLLREGSLANGYDGYDGYGSVAGGRDEGAHEDDQQEGFGGCGISLLGLLGGGARTHDGGDGHRSRGKGRLSADGSRPFSTA